MLTKHYNEVVKRIQSATPDFDHGRFHILVVDENNLDGNKIESCTLSKDGKWVCIPMLSDGEYGEEYIPICFEVVDELETFLGNESMLHRYRIFILNR